MFGVKDHVPLALPALWPYCCTRIHSGPADSRAVGPLGSRGPQTFASGHRQPGQPHESEPVVSRNVVLGILIGALLVGGAWAVSSLQGPRDLSGSAAEPYGFRVGERVPDLAFTTIDGWEGSLSSLPSASAIVLVVRDTGCPVSGRYGPRLSRMEREYGERGVQFVYLNLGPHETREGMQEEIGAFGFAGHYVHDPEGRFGHALRIRATTEVFVLDPSLTLVYRGAVDDQYGIQFNRPEVRERWLEPALDAVLAGTVPEVRFTDVPGPDASWGSAMDSGTRTITPGTAAPRGGRVCLHIPRPEMAPLHLSRPRSPTTTA